MARHTASHWVDSVLHGHATLGKQGSHFLNRFYTDYRGKTPDEALAHVGAVTGKTVANTDGIWLHDVPTTRFPDGVLYAVHDDQGMVAFDWAQIAKTGTTLVILMGVAHIDDIAARLMDGGLTGNTPVAVIADASLPTQRCLTTTLEKAAEAMAEAEIKPPAITVVGDVAGLNLDGTQVHEPSDH